MLERYFFLRLFENLVMKGLLNVAVLPAHGSFLSLQKRYINTLNQMVRGQWWN
jgi:hypothetical protein